MVLTEDNSEGESIAISLRHSVARALKMARVMRSDLRYVPSRCMRTDRVEAYTYARALVFPAAAFLQSTLTRFSSSLPSFPIFPGRFAA